MMCNSSWWYLIASHSYISNVTYLWVFFNGIECAGKCGTPPKLQLALPHPNPQCIVPKAGVVAWGVAKDWWSVDQLAVTSQIHLIWVFQQNSETRNEFWTHLGARGIHWNTCNQVGSILQSWNVWVSLCNSANCSTADSYHVHADLNGLISVWHLPSKWSWSTYPDDPDPNPCHVTNHLFHIITDVAALKKVIFRVCKACKLESFLVLVRFGCFQFRFSPMPLANASHVVLRPPSWLQINHHA